MGILDNVERGLERAVNGAFARTFRSGVQPVEIASAIKRQLDINAVIVDRDRVLAPNVFVARVSSADSGRLAALGDTLVSELMHVTTKHAQKQHYQFLGPLSIEIREDSSLTQGILEVDSRQLQQNVSWAAVIDINGTRHQLHSGTTVIGRGSDADITIDDSGTSRKHLEVRWDGSQGRARDLGSTNGSKINGQRFSEAALLPDTVITIGQTSLRFHLVPLPPEPPRRAPQQLPNDTVVRPAIDENFWRGL